MTQKSHLNLVGCVLMTTSVPSVVCMCLGPQFLQVLILLILKASPETVELVLVLSIQVGI